MPLVTTPAVVLHAFDYLETSRVLRIITREAGIQSVIAKGARRTRGRVGSGVDLFVGGEAQVYMKQGRDLHTLAAFDVINSRAPLALDIGRFIAASAVAELALRIAGEEPNATLYDAVTVALDDIADATPPNVVSRGLGGAWRMVAAAGIAPSVESCASCHVALEPGTAVAFAPAVGGALCPRCERLAAATRYLPPVARDAMRAWLAGGVPPAPQPLELRAHQRLLREFLREHLADDRPLRAFAAWESEYGAAAPRAS